MQDYVEHAIQHTHNVAPHLGHAVAAAPVDGAGLIGALFLAGLAGGFTHCAGMCGPFVLAQVSERLTRAGAEFGVWTRLKGAAATPYHLGRLTTYSALGAAAGGLTDAFVSATEFRLLLSTLLVAGALLFLGQLLMAFLPRRPATSAGFVNALTRMLKPLFAEPTGWRGYALGIALGFLPCGLLYAALATAAGSGSAVIGALGMAAFVSGTAPSLLLVGYGSSLFGRRGRVLLQRIARPLMAANAVLLVALAARVLI